MLLAISEMAAAMTVQSPRLKPMCAAMSLPVWRAVTTSVSVVIAIVRSLTTGSWRFDTFAQEVEPFFKVERDRDAFQRQAELDHGERHLRLDAHDDGFRAAQPGGVGE